MSEIIQLYKNQEKTIKVYPKTLASEVYVDESNNILNELDNKINFEVESENNIEIPSISEKLNLIINQKIPELNSSLDTNMNKIDELNDLKANKDSVKNIYYDGDNELKQNNNLSSITFRRKHSLNLRKTLKYNLANMTFDRNFIDVQYSDLYPNLESTKNQTESIQNSEYTIRQNNSTRNQIRRLFSGFNIFSSYEFKAHTINGGSYGCRTGFSFSFPELEFNIMLGFKAENKIDLMSEKFVNGVSEGVVTHTELTFDYTNGIQVCITNFNNSFEVYFFENERYNFKYKIPFVDVNTFDRALNGRVSLYCRQDINETITFSEVSNFYDCGLTQGDIRPIKYRNGSPIIRDGKIFFTLSSRFNEYSYQTIFSKSVNGNDYKLEGVLLFEYNNKIYSDIASSIVYDNEKGRFIIWNGAFSQNHILGYGECYSDILYGVNIISMTAMTKQISGESQPTITDDRLFYAKYQDEDPDIIYNEKTNKWNLIICRTDSLFSNNVYNYYLFESDNPFTNFTFVSKTVGELNVTGGSIAKIGDEYYLTFGGGNNTTLNKYYYAKLSDLTTVTQIQADKFDGGFRGWGSIYPLQIGSFTKYCWITFDRAVVSSDNHSYGNLYYFESNVLNLGNEYNVKYSY